MTLKQAQAFHAFIATLNATQRAALLDVFSMHTENVLTDSDEDSDEAETEGFEFIAEIERIMVNDIAAA